MFLTVAARRSSTTDQLDVVVPRHAADTSPRAKWQLNGTIRIRTSERGM